MNTPTKETKLLHEVKAAVLHVRDLPGMAAWYAKLLGVPLQPLDDDKPFYEFDMSNQVNLMLDDHRNMQEQEKYPICMMRTADIEAARAYVQENGISISQDVQRPHPGLAYFHVVDSEGNEIMIVQSKWINPNPVRPTVPDHPIQNRLNSVVIPVTHLKRATEWYSKLLGQQIKPDRQDGGPIYWFDMQNGTGILLDDNRNNQDLAALPTFMLKASNIQEACAFVRNTRITIVRDVQFDHYFIIEDPEGNAVMICL